MQPVIKHLVPVFTSENLKHGDKGPPHVVKVCIRLFPIKVFFRKLSCELAHADEGKYEHEEKERIPAVLTFDMLIKMVSISILISFQLRMILNILASRKVRKTDSPAP